MDINSVESFLNIIIIPFKFCNELLVMYSELVNNSVLSPSYIFQILIAIIATVLIVRAAQCSSIAELKARTASTHFFKGLLHPFKYLATVESFDNIEEMLIEKTLHNERKDADISRDLTKKMETGEKLMAEKELINREAKVEKQLFTSDSVYDRKFFEEMQQLGGPYNVTLQNGTVVKAIKIAEVNDKNIVLLAENVKGEQKKVHFIYTAIAELSRD